MKYFDIHTYSYIYTVSVISAFTVNLDSGLLANSMLMLLRCFGSAVIRCLHLWEALAPDVVMEQAMLMACQDRVRDRFPGVSLANLVDGDTQIHPTSWQKYWQEYVMCYAKLTHQLINHHIQMAKLWFKQCLHLHFAKIGGPDAMFKVSKFSHILHAEGSSRGYTNQPMVSRGQANHRVWMHHRNFPDPTSLGSQPPWLVGILTWHCVETCWNRVLIRQEYIWQNSQFTLIVMSIQLKE